RIPSSLRCFSSQSVSTSASGCAYSVGCVAIGKFRSHHGKEQEVNAQSACAECCARLKRGLLPIEIGAFKAASPNSVFAMFSSIAFALLNKPAALVARPLLANVSSAFGFFVVLLALLIGGALYFQKKRSDKIEAAARALGFTFRRKATKEDKALIVGSDLAKAGYARTVHNVLQPSGPAELAMFLFDYSYSIGTSGYGKTVGQTIIRIDRKSV